MNSSPRIARDLRDLARAFGEAYAMTTVVREMLDRIKRAGGCDAETVEKFSKVIADGMRFSDEYYARVATKVAIDEARRARP